MRTTILIILYSLLLIPCKGETYCEPNILGDVSNDCKIDFNDFAIIASDWFEVGTLEPNATKKWDCRYIWNDIGASDIAIDRSNNIYVTGGYATIKYDSNGNELWVETYGGSRMNAIAIDNSDNLYVTGMVDVEDYITIKYDLNGNRLWKAAYGLRGQLDCAYDIAIDSAKNVYVTGGRNAPWGGYATVKYDPNGNELWEARYNGPAVNGSDEARAIAVDNSDNIYVTGFSSGFDINFEYCDCTTIKYDSNGNELWVQRYDGSQHAYDIAIDNEGNVVVTGGGREYVTIKYNPGGNELWVAKYNGPGGDGDRAYAITIDSNDNIYVTGESTGADTGTDYATIKYDSNGNELWVARYNGSANDSDWAKDIALDKSDNVYVTGHSLGSGTTGDFATIKYDPNGNPIWVKRYHGELGSEYDGANALIVDRSNNVYVTGESDGLSYDRDFVTIKYEPYHSCTPAMEGDTNKDCKVDIFDLVEIASHWLECNLDPPSDCWE